MPARACDALPGTGAGWPSWLTLPARQCIEAGQDAALHTFCLVEESPMPYRLPVTVVSVIVLLLGLLSAVSAQDQKGTLVIALDTLGARCRWQCVDILSARRAQVAQW